MLSLPGNRQLLASISNACSPDRPWRLRSAIRHPNDHRDWTQGGPVFAMLRRRWPT